MNMSEPQQVSERFIETTDYGTVRVSLVKLPAKHSGMFESAVITRLGTFTYARNYIVEYAVDMYETLCSPAVLQSFIAEEIAA